MTALASLIERLEKAEGPDRELDGSIWWTMLPAEAKKIHDPFGSIQKHIDETGSAGKVLEQYFDSSDPACLAKIAFIVRYTASIDAALTLVPEGMHWRVEILTGLPRALVTNPNASLFGIAHQHSALGANPAIAVCIAALRARAAQQDREIR